MEGALGVVLEGRGRAEDGHHRIADELLDRAAGELDLLAHRVVEPLELYPHALRVSIACVRGRPDEVGEENRDELALFPACTKRSSPMRWVPQRRGREAVARELRDRNLRSQIPILR